MKPFTTFDINNLMHVSILSYAVDLAQNQTLDNAKQYLTDRFETAPLTALESIFAYNLGYELSPVQKRYVNEYEKAFEKHNDNFEDQYYFKGDRNEKNVGDYPDDFNPELYDL